MHASVVLGVPKDAFDGALEEARARVAGAKGIDRTRLNGEELKRRVPDADIPENELRGLVAAFKTTVKKETGRDFPDDPREQLWQAIVAGPDPSGGGPRLGGRGGRLPELLAGGVREGPGGLFLVRGLGRGGPPPELVLRGVR